MSLKKNLDINLSRQQSDDTTTLWLYLHDYIWIVSLMELDLIWTDVESNYISSRLRKGK